ncbi:MAG: isochorismatase family protein [Myxococcales bacterium]|nr:isochorismatase family protein [Myxococcales bacterium]
MSIDPGSSQLLVVDYQERLFAAMPDAARISAYKAADNLVFTARALDIPVTFTEQYPQGLGATLPELGAVDPFVKLAFAATDEPGFDGRLTPGRQVVVFGMETHICVAHTVAGLRARGFAVIVVYDACLSRRAADADAGLSWMRAEGALILPSETVLFGWLGRGEGPLFKAVSRRIR